MMKTTTDRSPDELVRFQQECSPVLVIEDDPALLERVCTILEGHGYPVLGQDSNVDVARLLSTWKIAGIIVSSLPDGMNAAGFTHWLSENHPNLQKHIGFLRRPFTPKRILSTIMKSVGPPLVTKRVLITDDEEPIREIMAWMLAFGGYRCRAVAGGNHALRLLDSGERFDLVTSDICNSEMDGLVFLEQVRRKYPDVPVLMVTAVHDISLALVAVRNGAYDYLPKPFECEQLIFAVRRALECNSLRKENRALQTKITALERRLSL